MGDAIELLANRRIDPCVIVPMHVAPHAGRAVKVLAAVNIDQSTTFGPGNHQRLVFGHLCKRMPHMLPVPLRKFGVRRIHASEKMQFRNTSQR